MFVEDEGQKNFYQSIKEVEAAPTEKLAMIETPNLKSTIQGMKDQVQNLSALGTDHANRLIPQYIKTMKNLYMGSPNYAETLYKAAKKEQKELVASLKIDAPIDHL